MSRNGLRLSATILILLFVFSNASYLYSKTNDSCLIKFREGVLFYKDGNFKEATVKFRACLKTEFILSDYTSILLSDIYYQNHKYKKVISTLDKFKESFESSSFIEASRLYANAYFELGKYADASHFYSIYFGKKSRDRANTSMFLKYVISMLNSEGTNALDKQLTQDFVKIIKSKTDSLKPEKLLFLKDYLHAAGFSKLLSLLDGYPQSKLTTLEELKGNLIWGSQDTYNDLLNLASCYHKQKEYEYKIKLLNEMMRLKDDRESIAKHAFSLGRAYLNIGDEKRAIVYFSKAKSSTANRLLFIKSNFYVARSYEFLGELKKAALFYRKVRLAKCSTEDEVNFVIKSLFRAGWVNYKVSNYKRSVSDFKYIIKRFGYRLSDEGYAYWLGKSLIKLGRHKEARKVLGSFYSKFPLSYYGLLCSLLLYKHFGIEPVLTTFSADDLRGQISKANSKIIKRALLLYTMGLGKLADGESSQISYNYNNLDELYAIASLSMILEKYKTSISILNFIFNNKSGFPDSELLKMYYPIKYWNLVKSYSKNVKLDPYMIMSIIRQESVFDQKAVSAAKALGLMQIIPSLGIKLAKVFKYDNVDEEKLLDPILNLKIGIIHFANLMDCFGNNFILAVAAYNSSKEKVKLWTKDSYKNDIYQFIEDIPYYETRKYIKMNIRNYLAYLSIYTEKNWKLALP